MTEKEGTLASWNRTFGFIVCRSGLKIEKYFLTLMRINICQPDKPYVGCLVRFNISKIPPKQDTDLPFAVDAEVYAPELAS